MISAISRWPSSEILAASAAVFVATASSYRPMAWFSGQLHWSVLQWLRRKRAARSTLPKRTSEANADGFVCNDLSYFFNNRLTRS